MARNLNGVAFHHPIGELTAAFRFAYRSSQVLITPQIAVTAPVSQSGIFTSIGFQWSGSAQRYKTRKGKAASGLSAVMKYPTTPHPGEYSSNQIGGHHG